MATDIPQPSTPAQRRPTLGFPCPGLDDCPQRPGVDPTVERLLGLMDHAGKQATKEREQATATTVAAITDGFRELRADVRAGARWNALSTIVALVLMSGVVTGYAYFRGLGIEAGTGGHAVHTEASASGQ